MLNIDWIRNRNQNFSIVGTGTAINHYGSTTLLIGIYNFFTDSNLYYRYWVPVTPWPWCWSPSSPPSVRISWIWNTGHRYGAGSRRPRAYIVRCPVVSVKRSNLLHAKLHATLPTLFYMYSIRSFLDSSNVSVGFSNLPQRGSGSRLCYYSKIKISHFKSFSWKNDQVIKEVLIFASFIAIGSGPVLPMWVRIRNQGSKIYTD